MSRKAAVGTLLIGGLLPIVAFTVIEDRYGPLYGLIAAMVFGVGEILFEWFKYKRVSSLIWISNGLIIGLGLISIFADDGIWFKLQPALLELGFAIMLWITQWMGKPLLLELSKKQNPDLPAHVLEFLKGVNWRVGFFMLFHAVIATWAAFEWSTTNWALLKGVGVTVSFVVYLVAEVLFFRWRMKRG